MKINSLKDNVVFAQFEKKEKLSEFEIVQFGDKNKTEGILMSANEKGAYFAVLSETHNLSAGMSIKPTDKIFKIDVPASPIGKVFNYRGEEMHFDKEITVSNAKPIRVLSKNKNNLSIEPEVLGIDKRWLVNRTFKTGIMILDSTLAIGKGQRELIVGDRQTGKTSIALDAIINQKGKNVICIYNMIGGKMQDIIAIYNKLKQADALSYTFIVASTSSDSAIKQWLSPYVATTFAEAFRDEGEDVLIVYDNLSAHAKAYRSFNLLMGANPGREAYPGDIFYIHSRLLERSGQFNKLAGGGSITSLPIVQTEKGNISSYISTNIISITDGQIFTSSEMFNKNIRPAIDINVSVSRVGGNAQTKYMKTAAGSIKTLYAQYSKIKETFTSESALSPEKKVIWKRGQILSQIFIQKNYSPWNYEFEWLLLTLMKTGHLDEFELHDLSVIKKTLHEFALQTEATKKFFDFLSEMKPDDYNKDVMEYFALQLFIPFIKWAGCTLYAKNEDKLLAFKTKYFSYPTINLKMSLQEETYQIYSAVDEIEVDFAKVTHESHRLVPVEEVVVEEPEVEEKQESEENMEDN